MGALGLELASVRLKQNVNKIVLFYFGADCSIEYLIFDDHCFYITTQYFAVLSKHNLHSSFENNLMDNCFFLKLKKKKKKGCEWLPTTRCDVLFVNK